MSHVSGQAVKALFALTECKASDDAIISLDFEGKGSSVQIKNEDGTPLRLGQLREIAAAFGAWL
jgi:hypothetical protein